MSAWLIYSMMGIYPIVPAQPMYTLTTPVFDKVTISLDGNYYSNKELIIEKVGDGATIKSFEVNGKSFKKYFISHDDLVNGSTLKVIMK